ncbi:hypothetical protein EGK14_01930 [Erwinia sp. 198]|nr:hypothetical protein EGK14_01930 [Erwinia sp. 198]
MGIQFGPYFPGTIDSKRNSSVGLGLGIVSGEISYGEDGLGFSFGVGPAWGWSGISTNISGEKVDINGSSGTEFYHYDFNQEIKNEPGHHHDHIINGNIFYVILLLCQKCQTPPYLPNRYERVF